jgi:SAM-dependent methyltransferase
MATELPRFAGSIPDLYERHLGPLLFEPYARDLAARVRVEAGGRLLELACGTGRLTRHLVSALPSGATIDATDLNEAMTLVARQRVPAAAVTWGTADATALPFGDAAFAGACCQFGVMFFPDKIAAARQVWRVLEPGAAYWLSSWSTLADNPLSRLANEAAWRLIGGDTPPFMRIPYGYGDRDRIAADLRAGGFSTIDIDTVDLEAVADSAGDVAIGLVQGTPMVNEIRERGRATPEAVTAAVAEEIARAFGTSAIRAPMRAHVVRAA